MGLAVMSRGSRPYVVVSPTAFRLHPPPSVIPSDQPYPRLRRRSNATYLQSQSRIIDLSHPDHFNPTVTISSGYALDALY
ncbi:uncharacterized protein N7484_002360 [Penicillium longicatenatum]|uniref:uncharacterized protein n=1 Tax=Penicillium longicatenatum TaxID=1561947 RepID=UPI002547AAA7|nr:uncharacterized protein N7484_002360 [Penicillium longicatenatum]KAJ5658711.1 hypothetical protein N7484_002360 [Penicillium longicatenatum]